MAWKDRLRRASFRGVEFFVTNRSHPFGRRTVRHDVDDPEQPVVIEDTGKEAREYRFTAFLIGPRSDEQLDRLIAAIEDDPSPGVLIHPIYGRQVVVPGACTVEHSRDMMGMESLSLTFIREQPDARNTAAVDTQGVVVASANFTQQALGDTFTTTFQPRGANVLTTAPAATHAQFITQLQTAMAGVITPTDALADLLAKVDPLAVGSLLNKPFEYVNQIFSVMSTLASTVPNLRQRLQLMASLATQTFTLPPLGQTATRQQARRNAEMVAVLTQVAATLQMAVATSELEPESRDEALAVRDQVVGLLTTQAEAAADRVNDELFVRLQQLAYHVTTDLNERGADLPTLSRFSLDTSRPMLVVLYQQTGSLRALDDFSIRNATRIKHPGFMAPHVGYELLEA